MAPAGNFEKLEIVLHYGADAVFLAGKRFSLRNFSGNFSLEEMADAIVLAHKHRAKAYVAVNIFARNEDLASLQEYITRLKSISPDGIIVADPAILTIARQNAPHIPIHLSTQANTTNVESVRFWQSQGVRRINAARELSLEEIKRIYLEAKEAGFFISILWGGEPTLRRDITDIIQFAKHKADFAFIGMVSNGYLIPKRINEFGDDLDLILMSLDSPAQEEHDRIRCLPGLYTKIIQSIEIIRKDYPHISLQFSFSINKSA